MVLVQDCACSVQSVPASAVGVPLLPASWLLAGVAGLGEEGFVDNVKRSMNIAVGAVNMYVT